MLKRFYSSLTRVYQHILPNPPGFEVWKIAIMSSDRRIKSKIIQCADTYQDKAQIVVPEDKSVHVNVSYRSRNVLGCYLPPINKIYRIYRDEIVVNE